MTDHDEIHLTPEEATRRARDGALVHALRRLLQARGETGSPLLQLEKVRKMWKRIPSHDLLPAVEKAVYRFGASSVTVEAVVQAWRQRKQRSHLSSTERYRRQLVHETKTAAAAAPPEVRDRFFHEIQAKLAT